MIVGNWRSGRYVGLKVLYIVLSMLIVSSYSRILVAYILLWIDDLALYVRGIDASQWI